MTSTTKGRTVVSFREVGIGAVFHMGPEGGSPFVKTTKSAGVSLASTRSKPAAPVSLYPAERVYVTPAVTPYFSTYYVRAQHTWYAVIYRANGDQIGAAEFSGQKPNVIADAISTLRDIFVADPALFDVRPNFPDETPVSERVSTPAERVRQLQHNPEALRRELSDYLQTIPAPVLAAALTGAVSVADAMKLELSKRGLDDNATWVGFDVAARFWGIR